MSRFVLIAETGERFVDFGPYVASINDAGMVAFYADSGVFVGDGGSVTKVASGRFTSHPDIDSSGRVCVYSDEGLVLGHDLIPMAGLGPLGPTMNDRFAVAVRRGDGVFIVEHGPCVLVADTTSFERFHGLPVIDDEGTVIFRADKGIHAFRSGRLEAVVGGERFSKLGSFPCVNRAGTIVFNADAGIFRLSDGELTTVVESHEHTFRGALVDDAGRVFFYATPRGGQLGIYSEGGPILSVGDALFDSSVVELALNPVSINAKGQLAIRAGLSDGRQVVVRAD